MSEKTARWAAGTGAMLIGLGLSLGGAAWADETEPDPSPTVAPIEEPVEPDPVAPTNPEPEPTTAPTSDPAPVEEPTTEPDPIQPTEAPEPEPTTAPAEPSVTPVEPAPTEPAPAVTVPATVPAPAQTVGPRVQAAGQAPVADPGQSATGQRPVAAATSRVSGVLRAVAWQATDARGRAEAQTATTPQAAEVSTSGVPAELPLTGDETGPLAVLAGCLIAAGGGLMLWARRARP
ncbi:LPXTG cell wall anchor domain-containing protein [Actinobaculum sp. 352]|uniref:LPXTG cell wall anchor domain-containing protein n=1 Tax=Actinobaculum sp. 352 TaxID=2490946 RepID=UPI000F7F1512|nr:LPXTG cell wall anchor domain-containing protein [Actinobaculum sp. 352]RTE49060.1 LPXTG cell wall anchor domain-containing protein [Actinobaculum sp. 352]